METVNEGVPKPISTAPPTSEDILRSEALVDFLKYKDLDDNIEENHNIEVALDKLSSLFNAFVKKIAESSNKPNDVIERARGKLLTFGSYRLATKTSGTTFDILYVAPNYVKIEDFFSKFAEMLKEDRDTEEVKPLSESFVPFIILKYKRLEFNVLFASLHYDNIEDDFDILDENNLMNIDEKTIRSINGCRTTEMILKLVKNLTEYRMALKILKDWFKKRGLSSKKMGYFGGTNLAIMMCYINELYPTATSFVLLKQFFNVFRKYDYKKPIQIIENKKTNSILDLYSFDPEVNFNDKRYKMAVLTPTYPSFNSTPNVNEYSLKVIIDEFERGYKIVDEIERGISKWDKLIEEPDFFHLYKYYVSITVSASTDENMEKYMGYCESKFRRVVESLGNKGIYENIHLYPVEYKNPSHPSKNSVYFIGLKPKSEEEKIVIGNNQCKRLEKHFNFYNNKSDDMKVKIKLCEYPNMPLYLNLDANNSAMKRKSSNHFYNYKMRRFM